MKKLETICQNSISDIRQLKKVDASPRSNLELLEIIDNLKDDEYLQLNNKLKIVPQTMLESGRKWRKTSFILATAPAQLEAEKNGITPQKIAEEKFKDIDSSPKAGFSLSERKTGRTIYALTNMINGAKLYVASELGVIYLSVKNAGSKRSVYHITNANGKCYAGYIDNLVTNAENSFDTFRPDYSCSCENSLYNNVKTKVDSKRPCKHFYAALIKTIKEKGDSEPILINPFPFVPKKELLELEKKLDRVIKPNSKILIGLEKEALLLADVTRKRGENLSYDAYSFAGIGKMLNYIRERYT